MADEKLRQELERRQIAIPVVEGEAIRPEDPQVRRPDLVISLDDRSGVVLFHVHLQGHEAVADRFDDSGLLVRHGTQRLAAASGGREEVQ